MMRLVLTSLLLACLASGSAYADSKPKASKSKNAKEQHLSGMSIVGNDEAPKSLAIVPWKGSQLGDTLNAIKALGAGRDPVDKDVFMRALAYYELRAGTAPSNDAARTDSKP